VLSAWARRVTKLRLSKGRVPESSSTMSSSPLTHRQVVGRICVAAAAVGLCLSAVSAKVSKTPAASVTAVPVAAVKEAHAAWRDGNAARLSQVAPQLRGNAMAPYADYWQIRLAPEDKRIQEFLGRYPGTFLAERLREDWLRGVARRGDWALLASAYSALEAPRSDVTCWALNARQVLSDKTSDKQGDKRVAADFLSTQWQVWRDLPEGCAVAARSLALNNQIPATAIWTRARALVGLNEVSAARRTLALLPAKLAPSPPQLELAFSAPQRMLDRGLFNGRSAIERELAAFAVARVASTDPQRAARYLDVQPLRLDAAQRAWGFSQAALVAARRLQPEALVWFARAQAGELTDEHCAWWARTALRAQAWPDVRVAIERMTPAAQKEARWQYWLGRALARSSTPGDTKKAEALWAAAAAEHGFYGQLARESMGSLPPEIAPPAKARRGRFAASKPASAAATTTTTATAPSVATAVTSPAPPSRAEIDTVARDPAIQRAVALQRAGLGADASGEWNWAVRRFDDRQLAAASRYAHQLSIWNRGMDSSERTVLAHDMSTRYPRPFQSIVRPAAKQFGVDEALVYSVMHQESRFSPGVASGAGARGLMQVMPATGTWLAGQLGWSGFSLDWLDEPQRNVTLGSRYLKQLKGDLAGSTVQAVAGYNAGPGRAVSWRGTRPMEGAIYAESIPIDETRDYVKRVMAASLHYDNLLGHAPQRLAARLGMVEPTRVAGQTVAAAAGFQAATLRAKN
jgi:soluble lytic murein transglycosylase